MSWVRGEIAVDGLLDRLRSGDEAAIRRLVEDLGERLVHYLRRLGGDRWAAEDLAQEVFVRLIREEGSPKTLLYSVGRNLALNHLRARRTAARVVREPPAGPPTPDEDADRRE